MACGLLCLGDCNGVSRFRGRHTILLDECQNPYTPLVPNHAENKGSHAFVVFRSAMITFVQAIASFGVTDMSFSRIRNHCDLRAYGIFFDPIFTQHRNKGGLFSSRMAWDTVKAHYPRYFVCLFMWASVGLVVLILTPFLLLCGALGYAIIRLILAFFRTVFPK